MFEGLKRRAARYLYKSARQSPKARAPIPAPSQTRAKLKPKAPTGKSTMSVRNSYDAAATGRRLVNWRPGMIGPNAAILRNLTEIVNRSRDLFRNNPWISRGIDSWVANEVGCGITFKSSAPDEEFRKRADELWEEQSSYFDADGQEDFSGMLAKIVRTRRVAGEIFIRRRFRRPGDGFPVPLQYQLLEPEFCPHNYEATTNFGRNIRAGIEFNGIGKRTAYWMYRRHPGDFFILRDFKDTELVPVPASEIIHHYDPLRPGQIRGVPAIVQAMVKAHDFDEYDDAELVRKKNKSSFTGAIQHPHYEPGSDDLFDPMTGEPINKDFAGVPVTNLEAGTFFSTLPGEEVNLFEGDNTGLGYAEFVRQQLLGIGAGQNVPYEFISGDFSQLNDRTLRVVLAEYHRVVEQDRWRLTIPQVCYTIWRDFIDTAIISGALPEPLEMEPKEYLKVECHPEGWPYLHALQDANADVVRLKAGLTSKKRILAEEGTDIREVDKERKEDAERAKEWGLVDDYDGTDPNAEPDDDPNTDPAKEKKQAYKRVRDFRKLNARHYAGAGE